MEHLNRVCKVAVANLGANKTPEGTQHVAKCVGILSELQHNYDKDLGVTTASGHHGVPAADKDKSIILKHLLENCIFHESGDRSYKCFEDLKRNPLGSLKEKKFRIGWKRMYLSSEIRCICLVNYPIKLVMKLKYCVMFCSQLPHLHFLRHTSQHLQPLSLSE